MHTQGSSSVLITYSVPSVFVGALHSLSRKLPRRFHESLCALYVPSLLITHQVYSVHYSRYNCTFQIQPGVRPRKHRILDTHSTQSGPGPAQIVIHEPAQSLTCHLPSRNLVRVPSPTIYEKPLIDRSTLGITKLTPNTVGGRTTSTAFRRRASRMEQVFVAPYPHGPALRLYTGLCFHM